MNPKDPSLRRRKRFFWPLIIIFIGLVLLLQRLPIAIPEWLLSWNTILIGVGLLIGIRSQFRHWMWFALVLWGFGSILTENYIPDQYHNLIFPVGLIAVGIYIFISLLICRKSSFYRSFERRRKMTCDFDKDDFSTVDESNTVAIENTFGGISRSFISKDFKGGYIKNTFGGVKVQLDQCDFEDKAVIHIENTFGGITLYVPVHWKVISEVEATLSGVDDKTYYENPDQENPKRLILKGKSVFGGIEIKNY